MIDIAAYGIDIRQHGACLSATVDTLPGCVAFASTARDLERSVLEAIVLYLDDHPDAPMHLL